MFEYLSSFRSTKKGTKKGEREKKIGSRKGARACSSWGFLDASLQAFAMFTREVFVKRDIFSPGCVFFFQISNFFGLIVSILAKHHNTCEGL